MSGLSALLVRSTLEMEGILRRLRDENIHVPGDLRRGGADPGVRGFRA